MKDLSPEFLKKIAHALEEEELDIYMLTLYCLNSDDLDYFTEKDRSKVKRIFKILSEDTHRHAELLKLIVDVTRS